MAESASGGEVISDTPASLRYVRPSASSGRPTQSDKAHQKPFYQKINSVNRPAPALRMNFCAMRHVCSRLKCFRSAGTCGITPRRDGETFTSDGKEKFIPGRHVRQAPWAGLAFFGSFLARQKRTESKRPSAVSLEKTFLYIYYHHEKRDQIFQQQTPQNRKRDL